MRTTACTTLAALLMTVSACGRWGFDAVPGARGDDDDTDAEVDAGGSYFSPVESKCTMAAAGPFVRAGNYPARDRGFGVWAAKPNILMADQGDGLHNLRFDGTTFQRVGHLDIGWSEAVWGDGQYFYAGSPGTGLFVLEASAGGDLSILAEDRTTMNQARKGWSSMGLQFVPSGDAGLSAWQYTGTELVKIGASLDTSDWAQGVWAKGSRVYFADNKKLRVADWTGSGFTETISPNNNPGGFSRVWIDQAGTVFATHVDGLSAYRVVGTALVELDSFATASMARDVWSDGQHVFVAAQSDGVYALTFANDVFAEVDHVDTGGDSLGVFGDGTFIYTNDGNDGLSAYSGFTCLSW